MDGPDPADTRYRVRAVAEDDLPLLEAWRHEPHVRRWWGDPSLEPIAETFREERVRLSIVEDEAGPLAFVQDYRVSDWSPHHFDDLPPGSRGLDMHIGRPDALGLGHGRRILRLYVDRLFAAGVPAVGIDPHPDNLRARTAFAHAGFCEVSDAVETRWGRAVLMHRFAR